MTVTRPTKRPRIDAYVDDDQEVPQIKQYDQYQLKDIPDAEVFYVPDFVEKNVADEWYNDLLKLDSWYRPKLKIYGREITQSRKIATYAADPKRTLKYSGHVVDFRSEYPPILRRIQDEVEQKLGVTFDHVMLNYYENGSVYIGKHRDNVDERVIGSLSLGAPRTFIMTHDGYKPQARKRTASSTSKTRSSGHLTTASLELAEDASSTQLQRKRWILEPGSLVVMQGETQYFWKHEIPKEPKEKGGRISLTFRRSLSR